MIQMVYKNVNYEQHLSDKSIEKKTLITIPNTRKNVKLLG